MSLKLLFFPMSMMLSLVILIWMAKPEWDGLKKTQLVLADVTDKLAKVDGQVSALEEALSQYKSKSADHRLINNAIPFNRHAEDTQAEIYQKMKNSNVLLDSILPSPGGSNSCSNASLTSSAGISSSTSTAIAPIQSSAEGVPNATNSCLLADTYLLSIMGTYRDIRAFIKDLGAMNRYSDIGSISISRDFDPRNQNSDVLNGAISVNTYYKAEPSDFQIIQHLNEPAGKVLLGGKIETDVIEKFRSSVASRPFEFEGAIPTGLGKDNIFQNPNPAASSTPAAPSSESAPSSVVPNSGDESTSTTSQVPETDSSDGNLASGL